MRIPKQKSAHLLAIVLIVLAGCNKSPDQKPQEPNAAVEVRTALAELLTDSGTEELVGTVAARNRAEISTQIRARIETISIKLGSQVDSGEILAELDTRDIQARVAQAQAIYDQASRDLIRFEELLNRKLVSQQEYDRIKSQADLSEATLHEAEVLLSYGRVVAPFTGILTQKMVDIGDLAVPGQPLFTVEENTNLRLVVAIPESRQKQIKLGESLMVSIPSLDTTIKGVMAEYSNSADPVSHSFEAKVALPSLRGLRAGQFGRLWIPSTEAPGLFIPSAAVMRRGQLELVYIVSDSGMVQLRLIRTGRQMAERTEVLSGLMSGERVVSRGHERLSEGDYVKELP